MTDIELLATELENAEEVIDKLSAKITQLERENAELRKDAERYRFLRLSNHVTGTGIGASVKSGWLWNLSYESLDAAIDEAMKS